MPDNNETAQLLLRLTPELKQAVRRTQIMLGFQTMSEYVRQLLIRDVQEQEVKERERWTALRDQEDKARQRANLED